MHNSKKSFALTKIEAQKQAAPAPAPAADYVPFCMISCPPSHGDHILPLNTIYVGSGSPLSLQRGLSGRSQTRKATPGRVFTSSYLHTWREVGPASVGQAAAGFSPSVAGTTRLGPISVSICQPFFVSKSLAVRRSCKVKYKATIDLRLNPTPV